LQKNISETDCGEMLIFQQFVHSWLYYCMYLADNHK
jgi:hypothetical protein